MEIRLYSSQSLFYHIAFESAFTTKFKKTISITILKVAHDTYLVYLTMDEMKILSKNLMKHQKTLLDMLKVYDLAVLANDVQGQMIIDLNNEVLQEHKFFASRECERLGVKVGDRITSESRAFLLSDEDFKLYNEVYCNEKCYKAGITDEKGYFIKNTFRLVHDARNAFVDFCIDNVLPPTMKKPVAENRNELPVSAEEKLIDVFKNALGINK